MRPTHAGGVVFRSRDRRIEYLVVRASNGREWVLPKGHIERGEGEEEAALREVLEEAGVRGEVIAPVGELRYRRGDEDIRARFFLMRAAGAGAPAEDRPQRWGALAEVLELLEHADTRALVEQADRVRRERDG